MKRTKTMTYTPTAEANELFIYTINDSQIYHTCIMPAVENLRKKAKRGVYDSEKAVDLFYHIATKASDKYNKYFGYSFNVRDRFTVAVDLEAYYKEDHIFYNLEA